MDKPLPSISKPEPHRSWNRKRIGIAVTLVLLVVIGVVVVSLFSHATPVSTANDQRHPVMQTFDGVEMVLVPPGCFMMGSTQAQIDDLNKQIDARDNGIKAYFGYFSGHDHVDNEGPQSRVCFDKPFWLDRYEVTNRQFAQFKGVAAQHSTWVGVNRPRETITWFEARDFCAKRGTRLPTEAEWEYAARGPDDLVYTWGNNYVEDNEYYPLQASADVGSKPGALSWVGAYDMLGNVKQWVSTLYQPYPYSATDGRESNTDTSGQRVVRGGLYTWNRGSIRSATRSGYAPDTVVETIGFRCVRSYAATGQPTIAATNAAEGTPTAVPTVTADAQWNPVMQTFDGVEMVLVPPGCFMMGSTQEQIDALSMWNMTGLAAESPQSRVCFDKPFWLDRYVVTNGQFLQLSGVAARQSEWTGPNRPRESITWFEARDFCAKRGTRLPTESEWEYAARGPDDPLYPWGDALARDDGIYPSEINSGIHGETVDVGTKPRADSWVGASDMTGNVEQWTSTLYRPYPYNATDGRESNTDTSSQRVLRGGSWHDNFGALHTAFRFGRPPSDGSNTASFRCARAY